jgi:DNA-binding NarL/FixJ family response regulator
MQMGPPTKSDTVIEQIRQLKASGLSNYAINKSLHLSASTVAKYLTPHSMTNTTW